MECAASPNSRKSFDIGFEICGLIGKDPIVLVNLILECDLLKCLMIRLIRLLDSISFFVE